MSLELDKVKIEDSADPVLELCKHVVKLRIDLVSAELRIAQLTPVGQDYPRSNSAEPSDHDSNRNDA
ncbi:MAG: hypothetical protein GY906_09535 [bacterium]|nr:hypothetical protein [bacterium]